MSDNPLKFSAFMRYALFFLFIKTLKHIRNNFTLSLHIIIHTSYQLFISLKIINILKPLMMMMMMMMMIL